jgi:hypothetical protein
MDTKVTYKSAVQFALENLPDASDEIREKLEALLESLSKKSTAERKPTAKQTANEAYKADILAFMQADTLYSVSDIFKGVEAWAEDETMTPARVSALLTQLKHDDVIVRVEYKRKAFFKLA